jgi:hypothetical protein
MFPPTKINQNKKANCLPALNKTSQKQNPPLTKAKDGKKIAMKKKNNAKKCLTLSKYSFFL